jgi:hypothetical protein
MLLSELLHRSVVDGDGRALGRVVEVHLVQDGPRDGRGDHRFRVDGVVVGRRALLARLGLTRPGATGPTLVNLVARAICGHHAYLRWDQLAGFPDDGDLVATAPPGDIPPVAD